MLASSASQTTAQTRVDLKTQSKSVDFSGASSTKPMRLGASLPATCSAGELFFLTSGSPGANVYLCPTANVWTPAGTASVFGRTGAVAAQSGDYTFSQIGGAAAKSQLPPSAMYNDAPLASPGFASAATNWLGFDSTANKWHIWDGQDGTLPVLHAGDAILIQGGTRAQPPTPSSGQAVVYVNNIDKKIHSVDDTGLDTAYGPSSTLTVPNASGAGTTLNTLTKFTGAPATAVIAATTDTGGVAGITTAGAGTTGSATIQYSGAAGCVFDGATTADDYVQISSSTAGDCHDAGSTYPSAGQVIGRVLSTNGGAGTYGIDLFPAEIKVANNPTTNQNIREINGGFDGGGSAITGSMTRCRNVSYSGVIQQVTLTADLAGAGATSNRVDIRTVAYSSYTGPSSASTITGTGTIPVLGTGVKYQDSTFLNWGSLSIAANTEVCAVLTNPSNATWITVNIKIAAN